jgi:hypothetical protein
MEDKEDLEDSLKSAIDSGPEGAKNLADLMNQLKPLYRRIADLHLKLEDEDGWRRRRTNAEYEYTKETVRAAQQKIPDKYEPNKYEHSSDNESYTERDTGTVWSGYRGYNKGGDRGIQRGRKR